MSLQCRVLVSIQYNKMIHIPNILLYYVRIEYIELFKYI